MDSINILNPSYGNPTDGTGSLVSNQIKFKELSRKNVERHMYNKMQEMNKREVKQAEQVISDKATEVTQEVTDQIVNTPVEAMDNTFTETIKEKSEYAKRLEARIEALEARDAKMYVDTLKPIKFENAKPLKIRDVNYKTTHDNGVRFSEMVEVSKEDTEQVVENEVVEESAEPVNVEVEPVEQQNEEVVEMPTPVMVEENVAQPETVGFEPETSDMQEVAESVPVEEPVVEQAESVEEIPEEELSIDDIREEIDKLVNTIDSSEKTDKDVELINELEAEASEPEKEEIVEEPVESVEEEDVVREAPEIVTEREAIIPVDIEEMVKEKENEAEPEKEEEKEEKMHFDYSNITDSDVDNTSSIAILEEMKKAKEQKLREKKQAEERALEEEKALVLSADEVAAIRKQAAESERDVQQQMEAFHKYIQSYDAEIEEANRRREKAADDRAKNDKEIEEYRASIASNEDIKRQLEEMMRQDDEEIVEEKRR